MNKLLIVLVFSFACSETFASVSVHNPHYCYAEDVLRPQVGMFSIISSYETSRGRQIDTTVSSCTPSKFWLVSRHGTRLPHNADLRNILENNERLQREILRNYEAGRTTLCAADVELLRSWQFDPNITIEMENLLTSSGWGEMEGLARRFQAAYPTILSSTYTPSEYFFRSAWTQMSVASAAAFADGLFGPGRSEDVQFEPIPDDDAFMRPFNFCPEYTNVVELTEQQEFGEGPEYQEMLTQVSTKLGFHGSNALRRFEVETLANICRFEQIWDIDNPSPICAAFSVANFQVMEYFHDLEFYYNMGYGFPTHRRLFENLHCELFQNLLNFIRSDDPSDHNARIFISHTTTINLMMVTLGAFEDAVPLTRHNFAQQTFRQWRSSLFSQMNANIAVIRYE